MHIVFVGAGPSCVALLCYWARERPDWLMNQKVTIVEKQAQIGVGDLHLYKIRSNSVLSAFLDIIPDHIKLPSHLHDVVSNIDDDFCALGLVSSILMAVGNELIRHFGIKTYLNTTCTKIESEQVYLDNGQIICADKIISAIGGVQVMPEDYKVYGNKCILSTNVLSSPFNFSGASIAIIGASHSAWSVVWKLLMKYRQPVKKIDIYSRHPTRVFFRDVNQAKIEGYQYGDTDICVETGQIHRFGGLRGDSKQVWRNFKNHVYSNVTHQVVERIPDLSNYDVIVVAFNYKRREIPGDQKYIKIGMMSGIELKCGEPSFSKSKDGIWLYGNDIAKQITNTYFRIS